MSAPTPEAFETLLARTINHATSTDPEYPGLYAETLAAYEAVTEERDNAGALLVVVCPSCGPRKTTDEDGCCNTCGESTFFRLSANAEQDPRIEAWRGLDPFDCVRIRDRMRAEAGRRTGYNDDKGAALWTAAAEALEALAERP